MNTVNKVILLGRLGKDPEIRYLPSGDPVTNFSLATTEKLKDKATNQQRENTEWHRIAIFGKTAEIAEKYLKKGSQVFITGKIKSRKYTDKSGVDKYSTEIVADEMVMLGSRDYSDSGESSQSAFKAEDYRAAKEGLTASSTGQDYRSVKEGAAFTSLTDEEIPF
jgi:single-strand DNA-binding protein